MTPTRHNYYYHTTTRSEILPIVLAGSVIIGAGIYTYRALEQMDIDAIEYQSKLKEYEALNSYIGGTMAIDVGTARFKLSHCSKSMIVNVEGSSKVPPPIVCVDREGYRSTPSSIWVLPSGGGSSGGGGGEEMPLFGRMAEARCYDKRHGTILQPRSILQNSGSSNTQQTINDDDDDDDDDDAMIVRHAIRVVAKNALDQVLGESSEAGGNVVEEAGIMDNNNNNNKPLFVRSATVSGSYDVRPIFTYPPSSIRTTYGTGNDEYLERYRNIVSKLTSPNSIGLFVSEPIAVVVGAEYYGLLPPESKNNSSASSVLVVDVGGTLTVVSLVVKEDVTYSVTLPFGGNTHIDLLVSLLIDNFFGQDSGDINNNNKDDDNADTQFGSKPILNDPAALQRLHDASISAIHELSSKTRTNINVPYLSMDAITRQPRHLELDMSRNVADATVESWIRTKLVPHLQSLSSQSDQSVLSLELPTPTDLTTLLSSIIAHILERTSLNTPFALRAILLVGGGARIPLVRKSMTQCVEYLAGDAYTSERLIMPEGEMGDELAVLGAAVWGSRRG
jgi:hypothetical protein